MLYQIGLKCRVHMNDPPPQGIHEPLCHKNLQSICNVAAHSYTKLFIASVTMLHAHTLSVPMLQIHTCTCTKHLSQYCSYTHVQCCMRSHTLSAENICNKLYTQCHNAAVIHSMYRTSVTMLLLYTQYTEHLSQCCSYTLNIQNFCHNAAVIHSMCRTSVTMLQSYTQCAEHMPQCCIYTLKAQYICHNAAVIHSA